MRTRVFKLLALLTIFSAPIHLAHAQGFGGGGSGGFGGGSSGFGGGSSFGGGGFGGGSGGFGGGSSGFGSGGFGGGSSGFGSGGFGGGSSGFGGGGGNSGFGSGSFGSSMTGQNGGGGYGGQNGNQNFVGRGGQNTQNSQNGMGQGNRAMNQFFTNMNKGMSRGKNGKNSSNNQQNAAQTMRTEVKVAFATPQVNSNAVATRVQTRMAKILADHHMTQPVITVQGDTAVISGTAASDSERMVIAQLVSLESGVGDVRNEMTVAGETPSDSIAPTPGS